MNHAKIAFLSFSLIAGGAERNLINLSLHLKNNKIVTDIIVVKEINDYKNEYGTDIKQVNVISILGDNNKVKKLTIPIKYIEIFIKSWSLVGRNKYKLLIGGAEYYTFYLTVLLAKLTRSKSILIVGNNLSVELQGKPFFIRYFHTVLLTISYMLTDKIICVSEGIAGDVKEDFFINKDKVVTIYNGVDLKRIRRKLNADSNISISSDIIALGRLVEKKGFVYLLRSLSLIKKQYNNVKLVVIGKGPQRQQLEQVVTNLRLTKNVAFTDFVDENPYLYLKKSKLFVFTSLYEGFGNVIVEAMFSGLPILSTDCHYGPREILSDSNKKNNYPKISDSSYEKYGVLVPVFEKADTTSKKVTNEEKILAKSIIEMLKDNEKRVYYRKMSLKRAKDFSIVKMVNEYKTIIMDLIEL